MQVFADEIKRFLYALALMIFGTEFILFLSHNSFEIQRSLFVVCLSGFYLFFCVLEHVIHIFLKNKAASFFSVLPGVLLFVLLNYVYGFSAVSYGLIMTIGIRILLCYIPAHSKWFIPICFLLDGIAVGLRFSGHVFLGTYGTDKALFICLVVLTFSSLQKLLVKETESFPFHFFILMAILLCFFPVQKNPIDWSFVEHMAQQVSLASENLLYDLGGVFPGKNYTTGYSSFSVTGGKIKKSNKPQLLLTISDYPYHTYTDYETGVKKMVKKTVYLPGGKEVEKGWICDYLALLSANEVDQEQVALFSKLSTMDIEYVYLNTEDEILPEGCLSYTCEEGDISENQSDGSIHKKGYRLHAVYLDIDYGSPYLTDLYKEPKETTYLSYQEACDYMDELYGFSLENILSEEEYKESVNSGEVSHTDLDTSGSNQEEKELALEITSASGSDYEKCLAVESYLRQFSYSTKALGGYQSDSSMASAAGMADIADRFLFETKEGYCVHYTAAMVTLLRLNGIPARPVMGYRYDFPYKVQNDYTVSSGCAHAWPEAYIKNVGWISFEPTGAYPSASLRSWKKTAQGEEYLQETKDVETPTLNQEEENDSKQYNGWNVLVIVGVVLGSIILLLALIFFGTVCIRKVRYRFTDNKGRVKMDVEQIKKILVKRTSQKIEERGLLYDYLLIAPNEEKDNLKKVFDLYYKSVYEDGSSGKISDEESGFVREVYERVKV